MRYKPQQRHYCISYSTVLLGEIIMASKNEKYTSFFLCEQKFTLRSFPKKDELLLAQKLQQMGIE